MKFIDTGNIKICYLPATLNAFNILEGKNGFIIWINCCRSCINLRCAGHSFAQTLKAWQSETASFNVGKSKVDGAGHNI